jgi:hypothetical protein
MDALQPLQLKFALDAQELFAEWIQELEHKLRSDELHPALVSHLAKYRSLMPSLALLFELADGGTDAASLVHAQQSAAPPGWFQKIELGERALRTKVFPHCPNCASYDLYRKNNIGNYECLTCGLFDISEEFARRLQ